MRFFSFWLGMEESCPKAQQIHLLLLSKNVFKPILWSRITASPGPFIFFRTFFCLFRSAFIRHSPQLIHFSFFLRKLKTENISYEVFHLVVVKLLTLLTLSCNILKIKKD